MTETTRRLGAAENELRELRRANRRQAAQPIVAAAVDEGRIPAGDIDKWLERAVEHGPDTVRDLLRERRPDRELAAANAAQPVTAEQDRALAEVFPFYTEKES
jgi:hypothetical protein